MDGETYEAVSQALAEERYRAAGEVYLQLVRLRAEHGHYGQGLIAAAGKPGLLGGELQVQRRLLRSSAAGVVLNGAL